jgi:hypothetical protein
MPASIVIPKRSPLGRLSSRSSVTGSLPVGAAALVWIWIDIRVHGLMVAGAARETRGIHQGATLREAPRQRSSETGGASRRIMN